MGLPFDALVGCDGGDAIGQSEEITGPTDGGGQVPAIFCGGVLGGMIQHGSYLRLGAWLQGGRRALGQRPRLPP